MEIKPNPEAVRGRFRSVLGDSFLEAEEREERGGIRTKNAKNTRGSEVIIQIQSGDLSFFEVGGVPLGFLGDFCFCSLWNRVIN